MDRIRVGGYLQAMPSPRPRAFPLLLTMLLLLAACSDADVSTGPTFEPTTPFARRALVDCTPENPMACVTVNDGAPAETRYTLFNQMTADREGAYLVDGLGRFVQHWETNGPDAEPLPEPGRLFAAIERPGPITFGRIVRFRAPCLAILDWDGAALWPHAAPPGVRCGAGLEPIAYHVTGEGTPTADAHHDLQVWGAPMYWTPEVRETGGDGRVLFLSHALLSPEQSVALAGEETENLGDEPLVEMAGDGETVLWEWIAADHIDELGFDSDARDAIEAISRGEPVPGLPVGPGQGWLGLNAASYLGPNRHCRDGAAEACDHRFHPDNVLVGSRQAALMFIVARHDHPDGDFAEGDVVWRLGPGFAGSAHGPIHGHHHVHMIPTGLPGEGNVLVFDNGSAAGYGRDADGQVTNFLYDRGYSRILEIDPVTGVLVWSYEQPEAGTDGTPRFYAFNLSSVQRLEDGNTFVTEGNSGRMFEVDPNGVVVWEFQSPFEPLLTIPLPVGRLTINVYRGYRVPPSWVPTQNAALRPPTGEPISSGRVPAFSAPSGGG